MFDEKKYVETYSALHASKDTLKEVLEKASKKQAKHFSRHAIALAAIMVLVVSSITLASNGIIHKSAWVHQGTASEIKQMGLDYPEQLGSYKVDNTQISRVHVTDTLSDDIKAFSKPDYTFMTLRYDKDKYQSLSLNFGKMDNSLWAYSFGYDKETCIWDGAADPDSYTTHNKEEGKISYIDNLSKHKYKDCTIYLYDQVVEYDTAVNSDIPIDKYQDAAATWTDKKADICFSLMAEYTISEKQEDDTYIYIREKQGVTKTEMLGYIKNIIDSCHAGK